MDKQVECSKCHKQVSSANGTQKGDKFVCNECKAKSRKRIMAGIIVGALVLLAAGILWATLCNKSKTADGFDGIEMVKDSMEVKVSANKVEFNLAAATAYSPSVKAQAPITNIEDFKRVIAQNVESASNNNANEISIPAIRTLFCINTNNLLDGCEELIKEYASIYSKTDKTATILVEGYTCDLGSSEFNNKLSEQRASTVKEILVREGVPAGNVEIKWYGKSRFKEFNYPSKSEYRCTIISIK